MTAVYEITQVSSDDQIFQILKLQSENLKRSLSLESITNDGFVTCEHDFTLLKKMNEPDAHIIAQNDGVIVGYCLVMAPRWRNELDVLRMMFEKIESTKWKSKKILPTDYITMGQVCIHKDHRSKGLFKKMYNYYKKQLSDQFKYCVTEVATENLRSLNAHGAVGFQKLFSYIADDGKSWELIIWDWTVE